MTVVVLSLILLWIWQPQCSEFDVLQYLAVALLSILSSTGNYLKVIGESLAQYMIELSIWQVSVIWEQRCSVFLEDSQMSTEDFL